MKFVSVDKIHNPRSQNDGKWCVYVSSSCMQPMTLVFMDASKKVCVEYAKTLTENPIISNGIDYGANY